LALSGIILPEELGLLITIVLSITSVISNAVLAALPDTSFLVNVYIND
jgi:hypothetical protein